MTFGDSIRTAGPERPIKHVTLLYIGVTDGLWTVNRWFAPIGKEGLEATEARLLKLAQSDDPERHPEFQGFGFEDIRFARLVSYFTIVLNAKGYSFHDGADTDPIWFLEKKENSSLPPPPAPVAPNKSFCDLESVVVGGLPALRCRNYLRNGYDGAPLKEGETQGFIFNIYIRADYAQGSKTGVVLVIDPDGTNSGPDG
ncbi:hypothetical protein [Sphingobium aquiterrae]|uniref:hypothetical protein n=1 Tax=Sphingobium aquiterrae TaxID=2038656 RepID=UPI00301A3979